MRLFIIGILSILIVLVASAQEIISELQVNPVIKSELLNPPASHYKSVHEEKRGTPIVLPFFDDFSGDNLFPSSSRWVDNYAFVNSSYPIYPPSRGVATLDAINEFGEMYDHAVPGPQVFQADFLTSKPIRLDSIFDPVARLLTEADSIYFSFFYQPQGRGNAPDTRDSLVLEFGAYSGDSIFSHVDSIDVIIESTYYPDDTILLPCPLPEDSIWVSVNPYLYLHNTQLMLLPGDEIRMPCDSVFLPETNWQWIWSTKGMKLDTNFYDPAYVMSYFKQVLIPITDTSRFFKKNFQFRFKNYVSLANNILPSWQSNMDQWHIDYIYLNINRTHKDTTYKDLTFVEPAPSMLKRYEAMPYNQYVSEPIQEMIDSVNILISNLDTLSHNSIYKYLLLDQSEFPIDSCLRGNWDIPPVYDFGFLDYVYFSRPPVCFGFYPIDFNADSAVFIVKHILTSAPGSFENLGDTMYYEQKFYNYYAYDDGVPEAGYGLKGHDPQLAYRFKLNKPDTIRAIQMYFNETLSGANQQYFYLSVWNDNNGTPGDVIYSQGGEKPQFTNSLDQLYTYYLDSAVVVTGTFYIGWIQTTDDNLNIGFDRNNNAQANIFYNTTGTWIQSMYEGALIMRPLLGKAIHDYPNNPNLPATGKLKLSPNPVKSSVLSIDLPLTLNNPTDNYDLSMEIYNIMGQVVYNGIYQQELDVSFFDNGLYIVVVKRKDASGYFSGKLIILH